MWNSSVIKRILLGLALCASAAFACPNGDCDDKDCNHHKAKGKKVTAQAVVNSGGHEGHRDQFLLKPERPAKSKKPTPPVGSVDQSENDAKE